GLITALREDPSQAEDQAALHSFCVHRLHKSGPLNNRWSRSRDHLHRSPILSLGCSTWHDSSPEKRRNQRIVYRFLLAHKFSALAPLFPRGKQHRFPIGRADRLRTVLSRRETGRHGVPSLPRSSHLVEPSYRSLPLRQSCRSSPRFGLSRKQAS